jgi:hypothetical protein
MPGNDRPRQQHSVVAQQWVCAWLRPHTVRVPSRKSRQNSERLHTWQGHKPFGGRYGRWRTGGKHLSMRRLVAETGEPGEDHSECTSDQQLQPGVVEEDQPRSPHHRDRCEAEGVTNTLDIWEICWGDPDLEWLAQSSIDVFGYATTHQRLWRRLTPTARSADRAGHASSRPPASLPVRSWDTRRPAPARFAPRPLLLDLADQVYMHLREGMIKVALVGCLPRGAPVPLARLAG